MVFGEEVAFSVPAIVLPPCWRATENLYVPVGSGM